MQKYSKLHSKNIQSQNSTKFKYVITMSNQQKIIKISLLITDMITVLVIFNLLFFYYSSL